MKILRRLYNWTIERAATPQAEAALCAVAFAESSVFPIPPDIMQIPMTLARPERAWYIAAITTVSSVTGGLLGYAIGFYLAGTLGKWIIGDAGMALFQCEFAKYGTWIILAKGVTPIPYKIVTIASGAAKFSLPMFLISSVIARGGRFFLLAAILRYFGERARHFVDKYLPWCFFGLLVAVVGGLWIAAAAGAHIDTGSCAPVGLPELPAAIAEPLS